MILFDTIAEAELSEEIKKLVNKNLHANNAWQMIYLFENSFFIQDLLVDERSDDTIVEIIQKSLVDFKSYNLRDMINLILTYYIDLDSSQSSCFKENL